MFKLGDVVVVVVVVEEDNIQGEVEDVVVVQEDNIQAGGCFCCYCSGSQYSRWRGGSVIIIDD